MTGETPVAGARARAVTVLFFSSCRRRRPSAKPTACRAVDRAEADALTSTLTACGDPGPELTAASPDAGVADAPATTVAVAGECVIANKTAARYDAVSGIGEVLAARLVAAQPFSSRLQLEAVRGIGPVKSEAVWSHFCGP